MEARLNGAWRTINTAEAYIGGQWRTLKYAEAYIGGTWRRIVSFVQALSLSLNRAPFFGISSSASPMTTSSCTATPTGGLAPFTYSWTTLSQSGLTGFTINSPSSASTTFTATVTAGDGHTGFANVRCTVTDALGTTAHADLTAPTGGVTFTESSAGGGAA